MSDYEQIEHPNVEVNATPQPRKRYQYPYGLFYPLINLAVPTNSSKFVPWAQLEPDVSFIAVPGTQNGYYSADNFIDGSDISGVLLNKPGVYWVSAYIGWEESFTVIKYMSLDLIGPNLRDHGYRSLGGTDSGNTNHNLTVDGPAESANIAASGIAVVEDNDDDKHVYTVVRQRAFPIVADRNIQGGGLLGPIGPPDQSRLEIVYLGQADVADRFRALGSGAGG